MGAKTRQDWGNVWDQHPVLHTSFEAHQLLKFPLPSNPSHQMTRASDATPHTCQKRGNFSFISLPLKS